MKCVFRSKPKHLFPCNECRYKGVDCEGTKGREPLTCHHCGKFSGVNKTVCYKRKGYNIRPCDEFEWD